MARFALDELPEEGDERVEEETISWKISKGKTKATVLCGEVPCQSAGWGTLDIISQFLRRNCEIMSVLHSILCKHKCQRDFQRTHRTSMFDAQGFL